MTDTQRLAALRAARAAWLAELRRQLAAIAQELFVELYREAVEQGASDIELDTFADIARLRGLLPREHLELGQ